MARSARKLDPAAAPEQFERASFLQRPSDYWYGVFTTKTGYAFEFSKGGLTARKPLMYAVGSGTRAYSYLMEDEGFLYEAPVAYYASGHAWGLAPGYGGYSYPYLTRPIAPGCLSCHASSLQPEPLTLNRYKSPAFLEGGVSCERCHGDGTKHVASMKAGDILNPARMTPDRRDSICSQCHLTGEVRVMKAQADWRTYHPGDRLSDSQTVFVRASAAGGMTVTGHVENLALSLCKRKAGDRLWCGSCHDPHVVPPPAEAKAWYRSRCLTCHATKACTEAPAVRAQMADDCIGCHMPKRTATDAEHVVLTDHSIPRRRRRESAASPNAPLEPFGGGTASPRDLALAYAMAAVGQKAGADRARAVPLLQEVVKKSPDDVDVLLYLAEIFRNDDKNNLAAPLYERAISLDPGQVTGSVGLGGIRMEQGDYRSAVRLWTDALSKNGGLELVRMNLALALLKLDDRSAAERALRKAVDLNPSFEAARKLLEQLTHSPQR